MPFADTSSKTVVTVSKPTAFPSSLRAKRSEVQTISEEDVQTTSVIKQTCEKQLRCAVEGTTVFYECDCGHKYADSATTNAEPMLIAILQVEHQQLSWNFHVFVNPERHACNIYANLSRNTLWHNRILDLPILLELGHIQCYDHTVPYHLFRIVQKLAQSLLDPILVAQTSKRLCRLVSDHAGLLRIAQRFCKTRDRGRVRQLSEYKGDLVAEQGRWVAETAGQRLHSWDCGGKVWR
jgi:hypothetical protein